MSIAALVCLFVCLFVCFSTWRHVLVFLSMSLRKAQVDRLGAKLSVKGRQAGRQAGEWASRLKGKTAGRQVVI